MQAVHSVINLNCYSKGDQNVTKVVAFCFPGSERCTLSNLTFDELLAQRVSRKLPCIIARVKDIEGKVHLFEGCAADALGSFRQLGFFKVSLDAEWKACSYIQYFTLVSITNTNQQLFHNFSLVRTDTFYMLQGEMFLAGKKPDFASAKKYLDKALKENPKSERALQFLGKLFFYGQGVPQNKDKAKEYFDRALEINPQNKFVVNRLAELEQPAPLPPEEPEDVAQQLEALSLEESSGTESEAPQETSEVAAAEQAFSDPEAAEPKETSPETVVASNTIVPRPFEGVNGNEKKPPCSCQLL